MRPEREPARPRDGCYKSGGLRTPALPAGGGPFPAPGSSDPPGRTMTDQAFVTLTTNDAYAKGALVLGSSLKQQRTTRRMVVLTTPQVSDSMRKVLETVFDEVIMVDVLDSGDSAHLTLMKRPELGITLTKLHCWSLTQYSKCVFMDADTLVLTNIDDLFEREELSAAPDPGWPDCFNSGVFVYQPSIETYNQLLQLASKQGSFDGGDQGLLNTYFSGWATTDIRKHLPFVYNLSSISIYSYLPAFKANVSFSVLFWADSDHLQIRICKGLSPELDACQKNKDILKEEDPFFITKGNGFMNVERKAWATVKSLWLSPNTSDVGIYEEDFESQDESRDVVGDLKLRFGANAKVVHFLGQIKPWNYTYSPQTKSVKCESQDPTVSHPEFLNLWWDIFTTSVLPLLQHQGLVKDTCSYLMMEHVSGALSHLSIGEAPATPQPSMSSEERKERWEQGQADYMGADSFDNIKRKLDTYLQ